MLIRISKAYNKKTGVTYVYEVLENHWDPALKQARNKRRLIGKIDPITGEIVKTGKRGPQKKMDAEDIRQMQQQYQERIRVERERGDRQQAELQKICKLVDGYLQEVGKLQNDIVILQQEQKVASDSIHEQLRELLQHLPPIVSK